MCTPWCASASLGTNTHTHTDTHASNYLFNGIGFKVKLKTMMSPMLPMVHGPPPKSWPAFVKDQCDSSHSWPTHITFDSIAFREDEIRRNHVEPFIKMKYLLSGLKDVYARITCSKSITKTHSTQRIQVVSFPLRSSLSLPSARDREGDWQRESVCVYSVCY